MRKLVLFVVIALLGFGGSALRRKTAPAPLRASVDVRQLTVSPASSRPNAEPVTAQVSALETIPLNYPMQYITEIKLDNLRNIYFQTADPGVVPTKVKIVRLNPALQQYDEINISFAGGKPTPDSTVLQAYDVDRSGNVYMAVARPEALLIQDAQGAVVSEIDLADFLPEMMSVDLDGNIWVGGRIFLSHQPVAVGDTQIRVYSPTGELLAIPTGGFDRNELRIGKFAHRHGEAALISGARMYSFNEHSLAEAREYPFKVNLLNRWSPALDKQSRAQRQASRLLLGLSSVGKNLISYGVLPDEHGQLKNGFVACISRSGEPLTSELLIPPLYGMPEAVDSDGNIYCLRKTDGPMVLTRIKVLDLPGKRGR